MAGGNASSSSGFIKATPALALKGLKNNMVKMLKAYKQKGLLLFLLLYLVFYTTDAASGYFMIFLKSIGFNTLQMGLLTSGAALTAMVFQPLAGRMADRSKTKNMVLTVMLLCAAAMAMLLRLSTSFYYIMLVYTGFLITRNTLHPLTDSITLEHAALNGADFGPIRTMGCLGYAGMSIIAGRIAQKNPADTFILFAVMALATVVLVQFLPKSYGVQRGKRLNPMLIFTNKTILLYTLFAMVMGFSKSFYHSYFSVYFTSDLGGSADLYGILLSIAALMEIPIIFSIDKLHRRFGTRSMLLFAALVETARWGMTALITDPVAQIIMHAVLGANNMTLSLTMIMFIDSAVAPHLKTTGQATYAMCTSIGSLLVGNLLGGAVSNITGIRPVFFACMVINALALILFAFVTGKRPAAMDRPVS